MNYFYNIVMSLFVFPLGQVFALTDNMVYTLTFLAT